MSNDLTQQTYSLLHQRNKQRLITALITPYDSFGNVDYKSLNNVLQLQNKYADGIVAMGTTQEYTLLSHSERNKVLRFILENSTIPTIVGVGESSTKATVDNAIQAQKLGAHALLIVTPYYSKYTTKGLIEHYRAVSSNTELPIIVYNVPQRTNCDLSIDIIQELLSIDNIVGIKQCSTNYVTTTALQRTMPDKIILGGNDSELDKFVQVCRDGLVSVLSNAVPNLARKALGGQIDSLQIFVQLAKICAQEVSPVAVKYLCQQLGVIASSTMRLPLTKPCLALRQQIDDYIVSKRSYLV